MRRYGDSIKRILAVIIYLLIICLAFGFRIIALLDVRQLLLVIGSTTVFYLINVWSDQKKMRQNKKIDISWMQWETAGRCALYAGLLQMFTLLTLYLPQAEKDVSYLLLIGMCARPMLYALCIWGAVSVLGHERVQVDGNDKENIQEYNGNHSQIEVNSGYRNLIAHGLTRREVEVALLICKGCSNKEIAVELMISETTVKKHISNIFEKTEIVRREEIIQLMQE